MKGSAIYLAGVGCLWALVVVWIFLALPGITELVSITAVILYFVCLLIGPLVLVVGSIFILTGKFARIGAVLSGIGCIILTGFVLYQVWSIIQPPQPLEFRPLSIYVIHGVFLAVAIVSDFVAYRLYRLAAQSVQRKQSRRGSPRSRALEYLRNAGSYYARK
jgi:hypothetical protein